MENGNLSAADIAAVTRNDGYNNGGMFGNDWAWIIILLLFGYGGRGFGGFGGGSSPCATQADVRSAVDQQTLISKLDQQTYGLADSTYAINNSINALSSQLAQCCCDNRAAIADVKYTIANEGCETRHALCNNTRDIIDNANANSRAILDFLTQDKIATLTAENQSLKSQAFFTANQEAQTAELIRRLGVDYPQPAYVVQPPQPVTFPTNCCGTVNYASNGCGCGF